MATFSPKEKKMEDSGLNSSILSPFCDSLPEIDCQGSEFPPVEELTCDPYSAAYTDAIFHASDLNRLEYSHVDYEEIQGTYLSISYYISLPWEFTWSC